MSNFLIGVEYNSADQSYVACFLGGEEIVLGATTYHDAVLEADLLQPENYELGYN